MKTFEENIIARLRLLEREVERLRVGDKAVAIKDGWIPVTDTWTWASATTINVSSGALSKYKIGQGIRLTQSGAVKYFYIVGVADTLLTITGGSDYTLTSVTISAISYTNTPQTAIGFPGWFSWKPTLNTGPADLSGYTYARFFQNGKFVSLTFGASNREVTGSAGQIEIGLPVNAATYGQNLFARIYPVGGTYIIAQCFIDTSIQKIKLYKGMFAEKWSANETGVYITIDGFYEAA